MNLEHLEEGDELLSQFYSIDHGKTRMLYTYRNYDGELFQTVCDSFEEGRQRRDEWLKEKEKKK